MSQESPYRDFQRMYANNRVAFIQNVWGVTLERWQEDMCLALDNGETRISVRSGHGVGKTMWLATIGIHFILTRFPCRIATTAPN